MVIIHLLNRVSRARYTGEKYRRYKKELKN